MIVFVHLLNRHTFKRKREQKAKSKKRKKNCTEENEGTGLQSLPIILSHTTDASIS